MKTILKLLCIVVLGGMLARSASAADTAGTVTLTVQLANAAGTYQPKHVVAVWVTNQTLGYIKCLWRDGSGWTGEGTTHLDKLKAARGSSTALDGYSGATISTYNLFTVTWNCSNANNTALAPDGTYYFHVETTDKNSAGPYSGSLPMLKGPNAFTTNYPNQTYIKNMALTYTPVAPPHDLAITAISPPTAIPNTNVTMLVSVTNKTSSVESFSVTLSNVTSAALIGTKAIASLAGRGATNVAFVWNTTNLSGTYTLRATAGPVTGETSTNDNTLSVPVLVQAITHDLAATSISPTIAEPNALTTLYVGVTNKTTATESFSVTLSNLSTATLIGSKSISSLAGNRGTNVAFTWNTAALLGSQILKATAGPAAGEGYTADNTISNAITVRPFVHDVGIASFTAPALVWPNSASNLTVVITNLGEAAESFSLQLFDDTAARSIVPAIPISNLAALSATNLTIVWTATNSAFGTHALRAVAGPVAAETALTDNTNLVQVIVANGWTNSTLIARSSTWRFHDQGVDLTATPWRWPDYPDSVWGVGAGPLGYGQVVTTTMNWGPDATNKYPASYLRQEFYADALPSTLSARVRRADGAVLYLNGLEVARLNMPAGAVGYTNLATSTVVGLGLTTYFAANLSPTNLVIGKNTLAAEVHRASLSGANLVFDMDLIGSVPLIPDSHQVDASSLSAAGGGIVGDQVPITVTLTNRGSRTETVQVYLKNNLTGQILGYQVLNGLGPAGSAAVQFDWATLGAATGANSLSAYTVVAGVTNFAGAFTNTVALGGTGFLTNVVNVTGAIGGRCAAVASTGSLLLIGAGATLEVWNCVNPAALVKLGQVRLPGLIEGIGVKDSFAFVACGNAGVQFVDLGAPETPKPVMTFDTSGHAYGMTVSGNLLFVADGVSGLRIINVASPATPTLVGSYYPEGPARAVAVAGTRAFLVDAQKGLLVLDAANPAAPTLLGTYAFHAGQAVAVAGGVAYAVDANNHFFAINVSVPSTPTLAGSLLVPSMVGQAVLLNGSLAYVPALDLGVQVLNVATPSAPVLVRSVPVPAPGQSVGAALAGTNLYVANSFAGFQVFDASAPDNPVQQSSWPMSARACQVAVSNNLACVAAGENGLRLYNVAYPATPTWIGWLTNALNARCVALAGSTAVVGDGQYGVKVVSVTNPAAPVLLGSWSGTNLTSVRNLGVTGTQAVASDGLTLGLFDLSVPSNPTLVTTYAAPAFVFDLAVSGNRAHLACGNAGLIVLEIGASSLSVVGTYVGAGLATGVSVSGTNAFLANGPGGWSMLDVSGPTPSLVKTSLTEGPVADVAVAGVLATLGNGRNLATGLDLTAPLTPVPTASFNTLVQALNLTASAGLVFAAEDEAGVAIGTVSADVDHDGLPDVWEQQIIDADPNDSIRSIGDVNPNDDFDGDGVSNYAEYIAGTSPTDAHSRFLAFLPPVSGGAAPTLQWTSVAGKLYTIHKSTNLSAGFVVLQDNLTATPPLNSFTDAAADGAAFYIISVR